MPNLKEWMDAQWRNFGVQYAGHGVVYESAGDNAPPRTRAGTQRNYKSKEQEAVEQVAPVPRKRVPKAKLEQAAAILAKVPQDELATFLARFGLSMSLAASIASLDNIEMIARQFLRATL